MSTPQQYNALKGVEDILPPDVYLWQKVENTAREVFSLYGFQEIRLPIIEATGLFVRSIGETSDIVEKEMYTFPDKAGRSITLRPEGTASVVRAYIEHHLYNWPSPQKFFYSGPMFRYERPQKGRFRQFHQIGVEAFGAASPLLDAEILSMLKILLEKLGLEELNFQINSIGCGDCRPAFRKALHDFFSDKLDSLCPDCKRRYEFNPLRILDCKVDRCIELRRDTPVISDLLCAECGGHFGKVLSSLAALGISHTVDPNMVRGLDYYTRTTFEVTSEHLGSQKAVAAGGRYDRLVEDFGGPSTPGMGFALGMERLTELLKEKRCTTASFPDVYVAPIGERAIMEGFLMAEMLRARGLRVETGYEGTSLRSQLRKANRLSSRFVIILGDEELDSGRIKWKNLQESSQGDVEILKAGDFIASLAQGEPRQKP
ncbi:MAG TPA: histidine--tRNA ligase [Thermodesulfovibrionales bacterium]|nr:histidine--tRNA ligase [Thermodesulfovibrionales bacterium]